MSEARPRPILALRGSLSTEDIRPPQHAGLTLLCCSLSPEVRSGEPCPLATKKPPHAKPLVANIVRLKSYANYPVNRSVKILLALISVVFIVGCASGVRFIKSELGKEIVIEPPLKEFPVGEKLNYVVKWMGIPAGRITLNVVELTEINGHQTYHILGSGQTNKFISTFYKINDKIHTYIDREKFIPWRLEEYRRERWYRRDHIIDYDHTKQKATHNINGKIEETSILPEVQNPLSCLYYFRTKEINVGGNLKVFINTGKKIWQVKISAVKKNILDMPGLGRYDAFMAEPQVIPKGGKSFKKGKMRVWFSADKRRIPLIIETRAPIFGTLYTTLTKIETADE